MLDLEPIRERVNKATPGPWTAMDYDHNPGDQGVPIIGGGEPGSMEGHLTAYAMTLHNEPQAVADGDLIAHAPTDLADLIEEVEQLREEVARQQNMPCAKLIAELRAQVERVRELHRPIEEDILTGDCAIEECDHGGECPLVKATVCHGCAGILEASNPYYAEGGIEPYEWPCRTIRALDGGDDAE